MERRWAHGGAVCVAALALVTVAGCGSSSDATGSASPGGTLDCALARAAMDDYSIALRELATSLQEGDAMSAIGAADTMSFALDQLESALPGMPAAGDSFLDASRAVAVQVKQAAAESPAMDGLIGELAQSFADPAFAGGGDAIDAYVDEVCPEASAETAP